VIQYNGLTLAYIGDAYFELLIRERLLDSGVVKVDHLHKEAIHFTSAIGQAKAYAIIEDKLYEQEIAIFKKGRNSKTERKARNASLAEYKKATGFEALIGYLYVTKQTDRVENLLNIIFEKKSEIIL
jgi:ribonuclease-3 family protein